MYSSKYLTATFFFLVILAVLSGFLFFSSKRLSLIKPSPQTEPVRKPIMDPPLTSPYYDRSGEQIVYSVNMGRIKIGSAVFNCLHNRQGESGRVMAAMTFETKINGLLDKETIYSDALTLLPVRVDRDIRNMFKHEKIVEQYDSRNFTLTVARINGQNKEEAGGAVFKNDSPIHNAVLLPHYVRTIPELKIGYSLTANLAKRRIEIKLVSIEDITVPAGDYKTYHFESIPRQIEIWLSADKDRIPVKIQGSGMFAYSLEMSSYTPPQKKSPKSPK